MPIFPWSNKLYQIKNEDELEKIDNVYIQDINGVARGGIVTGYSLLTGEKSNIIVIDLDRNHGNSSINGIEEDKEIIKSTFYSKI